MKVGFGAIVKEVPWYVWVCLTVVLMGVLTSYVVLAASGSSAEDLSRFINTLMNLGMLLITSGGLAVGSVAAINAKKASTQTNGDMKDTMKAAAKEAIQEVNGNVSGE